MTDTTAQHDLDRELVHRTPHTATAVAAHAARGALMGLAELVPGVSGGTVALVTGVYGRLLEAAGHIMDAARGLVTGPDRRARFTGSLRKVDWRLVVPFALGMAAVVATMAGVMSSFVQDQPVISRALFFGMVVASLAVPIRMARAEPGGSAWSSLAWVGGGAAVALSIAGGGEVITDPSMPVVFGAAALAVCALVLPGVSGSYLLLVLGLYAATTGAVADRNLSYLAVFAAGAACGLALFVRVLNHLMRAHRKPTLLVMTGLMLGSLRALWPWQGSDATLLAPGADWFTVAVIALIGAGVVLGVLTAERLCGDHASQRPTAAAAQQQTSVSAP